MINNRFSIAQALMVAALAFVGGIGVVYTLIPTFATVAVIFVLGLWLFTKDGQLHYSRSKYRTSWEKIGQRARSDLTSKLTSGYLLIWWLSIILVMASVWTDAQLEEDALAQTTLQAAGEGVLLNQLLVISYGAVGMFFLATAIKRSSTTLRWILILWLLYLCWGYISLFWSVDSFLTVRRLTGFALISLGSVGFGAGFYGSHPNGRNLFLRHIMLAGLLAALALLIPLAFRSNVADFFDPSYVLRPLSNTYSYVAFPAIVALLVLFASRILNLRKWQSYDWLLALALVLAIFVLKTRGPFLSAILALSALYFLYKVRVHERVLQIGLLLILSLSVYISYSEGLLRSVIPYLTRADSSQTTYSLTGRVPLWEALWVDIEQHPLVGVGFGAYWNPANLIRVQSEVGFPAVVAHNGFIDELLATGAVGLTLLLIFWAYAGYAAIKRVRQGDNLGWLVILFILLYLLSNLTSSIMQLYLEVSFIVPLALIGLMESTRLAKPYEPIESRRVP